jgi:hypothetical protein
VEKVETKKTVALARLGSTSKKARRRKYRTPIVEEDRCVGSASVFLERKKKT